MNISVKFHQNQIRYVVSEKMFKEKVKTRTAESKESTHLLVFTSTKWARTSDFQHGRPAG